MTELFKGGDGCVGSDEISSPAATRWSGRSIDPRLRKGITGILIAGVVLLVGPAFVTSLTAASVDPERSSPAGVRRSQQARMDSQSPVAWSVRGDLVENSVFTRRALARVPAVTCADRKLLYAGELSDRSRLALIACARGQAESIGPAVAVWAAHEAARSPSSALDLVEAGLIEIDDDLAAWAGRGTDGRVHVVALGRPGSGEVEVSAQLMLDERGRLVRRWRTEKLRDGVLMTSFSADAAPIVLVRRNGGRAVAADVAYVSPRAQREDAHVTGLADSSYRGPDPTTVRRLVASAVRHVLPSHPVDGQLIWSGTATSGVTAALVSVRLGSGSGLHLLVEEAGAGDANTVADRSAATSAVMRSLQPAPAAASSVVITLMDGRHRRVPSPHGSRANDTDATALAGGALTFADTTGRVTAVDASR